MAVSPSTNTQNAPYNFAGGALLGFTSTGTASTVSTGVAGPTWNLRAGYSNFSVQVKGSTLALSTADQFQLEGSLDGTNFTTLGSTGLVSSGDGGVLKQSTSTVAVQFVRLMGRTISTGQTYTGYIGCN